MTGATLRPFLICACSWLLLAGFSAVVPQGLHYYDPVVQLQALDQHARGESPAWNVRLRVDPRDLSQDLPEPIGWWPPAIPVLAATLGKLGLGYGDALRAVALAGSAAGCLGWVLWWRRFELPSRWLGAAAVALPWLPYATGPLFRFSGEAFVFGAAPWVYLGTLALLERLESGRLGLVAPAAGALGGLSYFFKYSLFVVVLGALAGAGCALWQRRRIGAGVALRAGLAIALGLAAVPLALRWYHTAIGAADPTGAPDGGATGPSLLLFVLANPVLGLADAGGAWFALLVYPGIFGPGVFPAAAVAGVGLPGSILLGWLCARRFRPADAPLPALLALGGLAGFTLLMAGLWLTSNVARDTRFFVAPGLAALPALLACARGAWPAAGPGMRGALAAGALIYLVLPAGAGVALAGLKIWRGTGTIPPPHGLVLPALGVRDQAAVYRELARHADADTVWIVENPELALGLHGRVIDRNAGRSVAEDLANIYRPPASLAHWATRRPVSLRTFGGAAAAPPGWTATLRGVGPWLATPLPEGLVLWSATMTPSPSAGRP